MERREILRYSVEVGAATLLGVGFVEFGKSQGNNRTIIRPPGSPDEAEYLQKCIKCGRCIQECPVDALGFTDIREGILESGTPKLVPEFSGCIAWDQSCLVCIDECPVEALTPIQTDDMGIPADEVIGRAQIDDVRCINCGNCYPICPVEAVLPEGEEDRPTLSVDYEACVGCGLCIEICPVERKAVKLFAPDAEPGYPISMDETH